MAKHIHGGQTFTTGGTLAAGQTVIAQAGNPGALIITDGRAVNDGTIVLDGSTRPRVDGATLRDIGVLTNAGAISVGAGNDSTHAALLDVVRALNNNGTIEGAGGSYTGGGQGGQILIDAGGTLTNSAMLTLESGASYGPTQYEAYGATLIDAGMLTNNVGGTIDINEVSLESDGVGATLIVSGVLQNAGLITVGSGGNGYGDAVLMDSGSLINTGVIAVGSKENGYGYAEASTLEISGSLVNQGTVFLQYGSAGGFVSRAFHGSLLLDTGSVDNSGTIVLSGYSPVAETGGSIAASGVLTNTGTILVKEAAGITVSGTASNAGSIALYGGTSSGYAGAGRFYAGVGGTLSVSGAMTNTGIIALGGGHTTGISNYGPYGGYSAELAVNGSMRNYGMLAVRGGYGSVPGFGGSPEHDLGTGATIALLGFLSNFGTIELQQAGESSYGLYGTGGALIDGGDFYNTGLITIDGGPGNAAGTLTIGASGTLRGGGTIAGSGVMVNQGVINPDRTLNIAGVAFTNHGVVGASAFGGTTIGSAVGADAGRTGLFSLDYHATLELGGAVAASQTVAFYIDAKATLELGDAKGFGGTLSGLGAGDVIDFLKLDVISATTAGDTLAIGLASGTTLDLALAAPLAGVSLGLQHDGNNGTNLILTASPQGHS